MKVTEEAISDHDNNEESRWQDQNQKLDLSGWQSTLRRKRMRKKIGL